MLGPVGCLRIELSDPVEHRFGERPILLRASACRPEVIDNKRPCASLPHERGKSAASDRSEFDSLSALP